MYGFPDVTLNGSQSPDSGRGIASGGRIDGNRAVHLLLQVSLSLIVSLFPLSSARAQAPTPTPPTVETPGAPPAPTVSPWTCGLPGSGCRIVCAEPTPTPTSVWSRWTPFPTWTPVVGPTRTPTATVTPTPTLTPTPTPTPVPQWRLDIVLQQMSSSANLADYGASLGTYYFSDLKDIELYGQYWINAPVGREGGFRVWANLYWLGTGVTPTVRITVTMGTGPYEVENFRCPVTGSGYSMYLSPGHTEGEVGPRNFWGWSFSICPDFPFWLYSYYYQSSKSFWTDFSPTVSGIEYYANSMRHSGWWYLRISDVSYPKPSPTPSPTPFATPTPTPTPDPSLPRWRVRFDALPGASCRLGNTPMPCSPDWVAVSPGVVVLSFSGAGSGAIWVENGAYVEKNVSVLASLGGDAPSVCIPSGCYPASSFGPWSVEVSAGAQVRAVYVSQAGATGSEVANAFVDLTGGGGGGGGGGPSPTPTPFSWPGCDNLPPGCRCVFEPPSIVPVPSVSCLWFPPSVDLSAIGLGRTPALRVCFQKYSISLPQLDFLMDRVGIPLRSGDFLNMLTVAAGFYIAIRLVRRG
jgi:hypothetical protein